MGWEAVAVVGGSVVEGEEMGWVAADGVDDAVGVVVAGTAPASL